MITALSLLAVAATLVNAPPHDESIDWIFRDPAHLRVAPEDEDGDVTVSLKVTVENHAREGRRATVTLRGVNRDGFELFDAVLTGFVPAGGTATLTDTFYVSAVSFQWTDHVEVEE